MAMVRLGRNLKTMRELRGWSLHELAASVMVTPATLKSYETGMRTPTVATLMHMQEVLRVGADILLTSDLRTIPGDKLKAGMPSMCPRKAVLKP
jgi:transcriptional regulator with XRE-family HTH domain